jgi:ribonuclease D
VWLAAVRLGLAAGPAREPLRRHEHRRWPQAAATRAGRLRAWRARDAQRLGLDPGLLLPNRLITLLAEAGPTSLEGLAAIPGIRSWRVEAAGRQMLDAMWPQATGPG